MLGEFQSFPLSCHTLYSIKMMLDLQEEVSCSVQGILDQRMLLKWWENQPEQLQESYNMQKQTIKTG